MPVEVNHQLLGFTSVDLKVVPLAPVHKVLGPFGVLLIAPISEETHNSRVIREPLQEVVSGVLLKSFGCGVFGTGTREKVEH